MDFAFDEDQEELRAIARSFLTEHAGSEAIRRAMESEPGYDDALWERIGSELGWPSVHIPESYGGLGLGYVELVALLEVTGEALLCAPLFSTVCLGANAILCAASESQRQAWLPAIAEGRTRATLAVPGPAGRWDADGIEATCRSEGDEWVLEGRHGFVLDGATAELLIVAARSEGSAGATGIDLFALPADSPGLVRRALPTMDQTRRLAELELNGVRLPVDARLGGAPVGDAGSALERTLRLASIGLAAEQVGGAQRCLDLAVSYARERQQFGRAIGSFQAIKHMCADMMVRVESARSAVYYAACIAAENDDRELPEVAHLAKAYCSDAFFQCAADCIQIHGGVGFTWEYDVHLYFKRARSTEAFLGDPAYHREQVARTIGL